MRRIRDLRSEIINKLWSYTNQDPKRSPEFLKWLENLLSDHSNDIVTECRKSATECDCLYDVDEAIKQVKKQF